MTDPYASRPDTALRSRAVAGMAGIVDPVVRAPFVLAPSDQVATAGSGSAQHIARHLTATGGCTYGRSRAMRRRMATSLFASNLRSVTGEDVAAAMAACGRHCVRARPVREVLAGMLGGG